MGILRSSRSTTTAHWVIGEQVFGLQILQTLNATERYAASAIGSTGGDDICKIGIPALHGNEAALFVTAQIANIVCDGWNVFGAFAPRHVSDGHEMYVSYTMSKYFIFWFHYLSFYSISQFINSIFKTFQNGLKAIVHLYAIAPPIKVPPNPMQNHHQQSPQRPSLTSKLLHAEEFMPAEDGGLIFNPYNPENREITLSQIQSILTAYGVPDPKVHNIELYKRAFVHQSYTRRPEFDAVENISVVDKPDDCMPLRTKSNERLEFIGDGVLECVAKYCLYRRFPKENEGFMTEKKIAIVKNESIGRMAYEMGLHQWFIISRHSEEKKLRTNLKKLGCLFEAFVGALFLDYNKIAIKDEEHWFERVFATGPGFQMAQIFIETVFEKHIDWIALIRNDDNYKNILQVKIQKEFKTTPDYIELGRDMEAGYTMGVYLCLGQEIYETSPAAAVSFADLKTFEAVHAACEAAGGRILVFLAQASHKIKKKAEQLACDSAIQHMP